MKRTLLTATVLFACAALPAAVTAQKPDKSKQPGHLSLSAAPNPVKFGGSVTLWRQWSAIAARTRISRVSSVEAPICGVASMFG